MVGPDGTWVINSWLAWNALGRHMCVFLRFPQDECTRMSSGFSAPSANGDHRTPSFQSLSPRRWVSLAFLCPLALPSCVLADFSCLIPLQLSSQSVGTCNLWISIVKQFKKQITELCLVWSLQNFPWLQPKAKSHLQFSWNTPRILAVGVWKLLGQHSECGRCRNQNKPQFDSKSSPLAVTKPAQQHLSMEFSVTSSRPVPAHYTCPFLPSLGHHIKFRGLAWGSPDLTARSLVLLSFSCGLSRGFQRCAMAQHILTITKFTPHFCSSGTRQPFLL